MPAFQLAIRPVASSKTCAWSLAPANIALIHASSFCSRRSLRTLSDTSSMVVINVPDDSLTIDRSRNNGPLPPRTPEGSTIR